jgi:hypothetical protein
MDADNARDRFKKIRVRFPDAPPPLVLTGALRITQNGREAEILANGNSDRLIAELQLLRPEELRTESLALEEIFVASKALIATNP